MKTIILPTDFSDNARHAHKYAMTIFGMKDVRYVLINAYELKYKPTSMMINIEEEMKLEAEEDLKKEMEALKAEAGGDIEIETRAEPGALPSVMEGICREGDIDYIVMGTRGASGVAAVIGSNTYDIVKNVEVPVLTVPEEAEVKTPKKFLLATDFKAMEENNVLAPMVEVCKRLDAEVAILNVVKEKELVDTQEAAEGVKLHRYLEDVNHSFYFIENDDVEEGINSFAVEKNVDVITMVSREESLWHLIFNPSETRKMTLHSKIPVLIIHE